MLVDGFPEWSQSVCVLGAVPTIDLGGCVDGWRCSYGVEKLTFVHDLTVDTWSTTFQVWRSSVAWLEWRKNRMNKGVHPVSLSTRSQIAAVLGAEVRLQRLGFWCQDGKYLE